MMPLSAGSAASASPGRPSVTRLIHRIWIGSSGIGSPSSGARKHRPDLAGVAGQHVADELADVVVDAPAFAHRGDDGGEIVVQQHHGATASRATSVPTLPMATPMSARFSAGASLTPSPVIATISPLRLQRRDDADLLRRIDPGVDAHVRRTRSRSSASDRRASSRPVSTARRRRRGCRAARRWRAR